MNVFLLFWCILDDDDDVLYVTFFQTMMKVTGKLHSRNTSSNTPNTILTCLSTLTLTSTWILFVVSVLLIPSVSPALNTTAVLMEKTTPETRNTSC